MWKMGALSTFILTCLSFFNASSTSAVDSKYLTEGLKARGIAGYMNFTWDGSPTLRYFLSQAQLSEMAGYAGNSTVKDVQILKSSLGFGVDRSIAEISTDKGTCILYIMSADEDNSTVYQMGLVNLNDSSVVANMSNLINILEDIQLPNDTIAEGRKVLQDMFESRDSKRFNDYQHSLAKKHESLPSHVSIKLADIDKDMLEKNRVLELLKVKGEVRFLGGKNLVGNHRIAMYGIPSAIGPVVFFIHYQMTEPSPVIVDATLAAGTLAMPFLPYYTKAFSQVK